MPATFATSDWLRRAAAFWAEADATDDLHMKRLRIMLAQGCERIAHHVAAKMKAELIPKANTRHPKPSLPESLLRGLAALLATPFLVLTLLMIGCSLKLSGKLPVNRRMTFAWMSATSLTWPQLIST